MSFPSRYRAASHFRPRTGFFLNISKYPSFHLVIERLLISGHTPSLRCRWHSLVSISLSSGFSFQGKPRRHGSRSAGKFQSRYRAASHFRLTHPYRGLKVVWLSFQSRYRAASHFRTIEGGCFAGEIFTVSISLSSGFSFQVPRARHRHSESRHR